MADRSSTRPEQRKNNDMTSAQNESQALGALAARQLANATKTVPQLETITPRFCCIC